MRIFKGLDRTFVVFLIIVFAFMNTADAQGDKFSFRMRGIGQGLYGFVDDLYSDLSFNPSFINFIKISYKLSCDSFLFSIVVSIVVFVMVEDTENVETTNIIRIPNEKYLFIFFTSSILSYNYRMLLFI